MRRPLLIASGLLALCACSPSAMPRHTGVYLLVDTSGTYNRQVSKAEQIILYALSRLQPADSIAVARIDTGSFTEKNIIAKTTLDERPSTANQQKRAFASRVERFIDQSTPAPYTDITGGLLQALEFLKEKDTGRKEILIFYDMKEQTDAGLYRTTYRLKGDNVEFADAVIANLTDGENPCDVSFDEDTGVLTISWSPE